MKSLKQGALRLFISLFSLGVLVYLLRDKLGEAIHILSTDVDWNWFLICVGVYVGVQFIMAYRLYKIFDVQGIRLTYKETAYLCFVGLFFNLFLPSAVGGDVAKIFYAAKHSGKKVESTTSVIVDRLMGFVAIMIIASFALFLMGGTGAVNPNARYIVLFFIFVLTVMVTLLISRRFSAPLKKIILFLIPSHRIKEKLSQLYAAIYSCKKSPATLLFCILISIVGQSLIIVMYSWLCRALGLEVPAQVFFLIVPMITIASMAPSLGGLGVREAGAIYFFTQYMPAERALALSLLVDMMIYGFGLFAGVVYGLAGGHLRKELNQKETAA